MSAITVNGAELHYDEINSSGESDGGAEKDVVVWIHGGLFSAPLYHSLVEQMPDYRHIALDLRGHGRSAAVADDATVSRMADDTWELLAQLRIEKFICIGHSMGNAVGMRLASRHPGAVSAAVSLAGVPLVGMPDSTREANAGLAAFGGNQEAFVGMLGSLFVHEGMGDIIKACAASAALVGNGPLTSIAHTELYLDDSADILPGLTQPWLFLIPAEDLAIPAESQLASAQAVPGARAVWLNGEGHMYPQERPEETAAWIRAFLGTLPHAR